MNARLRIAVPIAVLASLGTGMNLSARSGDSPGDVTFTKDIAPILQRHCQRCHQPNGVAPMALVTYEEIRPWARARHRRVAPDAQRPSRRMPCWCGPTIGFPTAGLWHREGIRSRTTP